MTSTVRRGRRRHAGGDYDGGVSTGPDRYFSPEAAEALLPQIETLLRRARDLLAQLDAARPSRRASSNGHVRLNGHAERPSQAAQALADALAELVGRIQSHGIVVRDIRAGLIDFPSRREGVDVFLCWKLGEPLRIEWWHPIHTGIAGRQRL